MIKGSLLKLSNAKIKSKDNDLIENKLIRATRYIKQFLQSKDSYIFIVPFIITLFILCLFPLPLPGIFNIEKKSADILIDSRITTIAAITSISLVVVGFLLTNLHEKRKDSYEMLFKATYLHAIIYFIFSSLGCLTILSFLRDNISNPSEESAYIKAVILGLYIILAILFMIGYLFTNVLQFTNPSYLNGLMGAEMIISAKKILLNDLRNNISKRIYTEFLLNNGGEKVGLFENMDGFFELTNQNHTVISDVNILKLKKWIIEQKEISNDFQLKFIQLGIFDHLSKDQRFLWSRGINISKTSFNRTKKFFIFKKPSKKEFFFNSFTTFKQSLQEKLSVAIINNDMTAILNILEIYDDLNDLYLTYSEFYD